MLGRRWDWASRGEQRSLLAAFGSQAGGSVDWRAPNRDGRIHIGIDIHLLIAGHGPRRKSSRMPGRAGTRPSHLVPRKPSRSNLTLLQDRRSLATLGPLPT